MAVPAAADPTRMARGPQQRLVVIGNGMATARVLETLSARAPGRYRITVFGAEPQARYNRILLSSLLAGEVAPAALTLASAADDPQRGITVVAGDPVVQIDRERRQVVSRAGVVAGYDRLLIATGSVPVRLPIPGNTLGGVVTFRSFADVDAMLARVAPGRPAVVIGGGLLGVEAAEGLRRRGMAVTLVHRAAGLLNQQLDAAAAALLAETLRGRGLQLRLSQETAALVGEGGQVRAVQLASGEILAADLVVMAVGVRPDIALAREAGLQCDRGIVVDDTLQTDDPRIQAVGECVQHRGVTFGLVAPVWEQARVCAEHLAGVGGDVFRAPETATRLKVSGIEVYSAGVFDGDTNCENLVLRAPRRGIYRRLVLRDARVVGAVLFGDTSDGSWYHQLMADNRDISDVRQRLLFGRAYCDVEA